MSLNGRPADHPPGLIGVIAQDLARFSMFGASLTGLDVPPGTQIKWVMGYDVASSTNELVRALMASPTAEWLFILGDDHVFGEGLLRKLLDRQVDVVVPLCLTRNPPYKPVAFTEWAQDGAGGRQGNLRRRLILNEHPDGGLVPIHSAGDAGMLVRRPVLESLDDPWFELGRVVSTDAGEDVYFCDKARHGGWDLYCDLDALLGHCTTATVWPVKQPFGWTYGFGFMGGLQVSMPLDAWEDADETLRAAYEETKR